MNGIRISKILLLGCITLGMAAVLSDRMGGQDRTGEATSSSPTATFHAFGRMVTIDVVAKDKRGHIVPGLTGNDFQVLEQVPPKKQEREQEIRQFVEVNPKVLAQAAKQGSLRMPAGVYSNLVTTRLAVPPTILLLDGLNTEGDSGLQARRQMVKMLASIPEDTPVAVFLLAHDLLLLQSFTKDPKQLREVAERVQKTNLDNGGISVDPHDDRFSLSNQTTEMFGGDDEAMPSTVNTQPTSAPSAVPSGPMGGELQMAEIRRFEKETTAANLDMRVRETLDALRALARHVSGYPGRKNLIWISTSFPLTIAPDATATHNLTLEGAHSYEDLVAGATNALADAKVSVYPINPAGVQTQSFYQALNAPVTLNGRQQPYAESRNLNRESLARFSSIESMMDLAKQTGGSICVNNNDLGDCVKTAVEEGSSYYELNYYPTSGDWHGEFHHIIVRTKRPGVQLSYREGYFARETAPSKDKGQPGNDPVLEEAACGDLLTSTSILVVSRVMPPDTPQQLKYYLSVDTRMLTAANGDDGKREISIAFAVCSFDRSGKAIQYLQDKVTQKFTAEEYSSMRGLPHIIEFTPRDNASRIRLLVRDQMSGEIGSLDVPLGGTAAAKSANGARPATRPD